jgi:prepilin-type N-terminal cleavage/methylation domain-containing protein
MTGMLRICEVEKGVSLAEVLIALLIISLMAVAIIAGVNMSVKSNEVSSKIISAESLARAELDYVKSIANTEAWYLDSWTPPLWTYTVAKSPLPSTPPRWDSAHTGLPDGYDGYSVTCSASTLPVTPIAYDANIQKITVTVYSNGVQVFQIVTDRTR